MDVPGWSKPFLTEFINIYQACPCLWSVKSKEYLNKNLRNHAYKRLVQFCKPTFPEANKDFVAKKIQSLRGSFRKELKRVKESQRSGRGVDETYAPSLWYYDQLLFTLDSEIVTPSVCNTQQDELEEDTANEGEEDESTMDTLAEEVSDFQTDAQTSQTNTSTLSKSPPTTAASEQTTTRPTSKSGGNKRRKIADTRMEFMEACTKSLSLPDKEISEYEATGINVAKKLARMDPIQALYAEGLISKILQKGMLKTLSDRTDVCELSSFTLPQYDSRPPPPVPFNPNLYPPTCISTKVNYPPTCIAARVNYPPNCFTTVEYPPSCMATSSSILSDTAVDLFNL